VTSLDQDEKARVLSLERRALLAFAAGFTATIFGHQPVLALLHAADLTTRGAYDMAPAPPFGIPSVISLAFWGGVWGVVMVFCLLRIRGIAAFFIAATLFGAILPTLVAGFVVAPLKGLPRGSSPSMAMVGLLVNAAWGLETAVVYRLLHRSPMSYPAS
jgi:hypothetical protein